MAVSLVEKYEHILAADPKSRIFVELAKALVERGEHARAVEVCRRGLEFHPGSILGRVVWGRALLEGGDLKGAMDQFDIAIGLEPGSPYAFNHVGEVLLAKGLYREALPVLARAAELQPADAKVRGWLADAMQKAKEAGSDAASAPEAGAAAEEQDEETTASFGAVGPAAAKRAPKPKANGVPAGETQPFAAPGDGAAGAGTGSAGAGDGKPQPELEDAAGAAAGAADSQSVRPERSGAEGAAESKDAGEVAESKDAPPRVERAASPAPPPPLPPPVPARAAGPRSVLHMIPGEMARDVLPSLASRLNIPAVHATAQSLPAVADPADAERAAAEYERTLREKLLAVPEPPPSFVHRHRRLVLAGTVAVALGAAAGVYLFVSARNAAQLAVGAAAKGRVGLARDTAASLREAARLLSEARKRSADPEVGTLLAEVSAILAVEHGDDDAGATARALVDSGKAADGAAAVAWLLADGPPARAATEGAILAARPSQGAFLQALAGRILVARGELEGGRGRLEIAARANPPLLRAMSDLGDVALAGGDPEGALAYYGAALAAQPTHPRSVVGAAEARLALGRDLDLSQKDFDAVDADAGSAPPRDVRLRFEIARARVVAALGEPGPAATRLSRVAERDGESARLAAALADVHLAARAYAQAESAAARAVAKDPKDPELRVLLARARIGRGRFGEALQATEGADGRAVRIQRAIARYRLGQWTEARSELERTGRDGKLPAEAAVWFALVDVASGKADRALPLLERLVQARPPAPLAHFAQGRALEATGRRDEAEAAYRAAAEREPLAPEGHAALGKLLLAAGRAKDAVAPLEKAAKLDASDLATRRALGEARLAAGHPGPARADLDFVLLAAPRDVAALRTLSAAWLAEGEPREARLAADRAAAIAPKDPAVLVAAARAAAASGDVPAAKKLAARAVKAGASGADRDEAKRLAAGLLPRKR